MPLEWWLCKILYHHQQIEAAPRISWGSKIHLQVVISLLVEWSLYPMKCQNYWSYGPCLRLFTRLDQSYFHLQVDFYVVYKPGFPKPCRNTEDNRTLDPFHFLQIILINNLQSKVSLSIKQCNLSFSIDLASLRFFRYKYTLKACITNKITWAFIYSTLR